MIALTGLASMQPFIVLAQKQAGVRRIGYLSAPTQASVKRAHDEFVNALRDLGWVIGKNLAIEYRWADGKVERLPALADELVKEKVELIVAPAGSAAFAAKNATSTIPIVMMFPTDPVATGLVQSLRRPGGNVTGTSFAPSADIFGKQLQMLKEAIPNASRVVYLWNPAEPGSDLQLKAVNRAALALNVRLKHLEARTPAEIEKAFQTMTKERIDALLVSRDSIFLVTRERVAALALKAKLPTMHSFRDHVEAGGLISYAININSFIVHAARFVDKILRGANPGELPVEQPTQFELVVNINTARQLGITIPNSILVRADQVIE